MLHLCPADDLHSSNIISEVLDDVEKRSFTPQDPDDGKDFNVSDNLHWSSLGEKVHEFQVALSWEECVQLAWISPFWYFLETKDTF